MTWPTDRPGYPLHAERDGWHWLQVSDWPPHAEEWSAARREWKGYHGNKAFDVREGMRALIRYLGPCYTQADLDAAVQAEREAIAKWHDGRATIYRVTAARLTGMNRDSFDGYARKEQDAADYIRSRGPTPALDAALTQARRETWARAAEIAERVAIPEDCHGVEAHGRLMAAHAAADAIRSAAAGEEGK